MYDRFNVFLFKMLRRLLGGDVEEHTSTQSSPPFPCCGDSTHLKLEKILLGVIQGGRL